MHKRCIRHANSLTIAISFLFSIFLRISVHKQWNCNCRLNARQCAQRQLQSNTLKAWFCASLFLPSIYIYAYYSHSHFRDNSFQRNQLSVPPYYKRNDIHIKKYRLENGKKTTAIIDDGLGMLHWIESLSDCEGQCGGGDGDAFCEFLYVKKN